MSYHRIIRGSWVFSRLFSGSLKSAAAPGSRSGEPFTRLLGAQPDTTFLCTHDLSFVSLHSKAEHFLGKKNTPAQDSFLDTHASISQASGHSASWFLKRRDFIKRGKNREKYKSIPLLPHHQSPAFASNRDQQIPVWAMRRMINLPQDNKINCNNSYSYCSGNVRLDVFDCGSSQDISL